MKNETLNQRNPICCSPEKPFRLTSPKNTHGFYLTGLAAQGGSSLIYYGKDVDDSGNYQSTFFVKEYYPLQKDELRGELRRSDDGITLRFEDGSTLTEKDYARSKNEYEIMWDIAIEDSGVRNTACFSPIDQFIASHGIFTIIETVEGQSMSEIFMSREKSSDLQWIVKMTLSLIQKERHLLKKGYLHGDIAPDNIFCLKDREEVFLLDYSSAKKISALPTAKISEGSYKKGFSAPEIMACLTDPNMMNDTAWREALTPSADLYSITAVAYALITGRPPISQPKKDFLSGNTRLDHAAMAQLEDFLIMGLSPQPEERFNQDVFLALDQMEMILKGLLTALDPEMPFVTRKQINPYQYFRGREEAIQEIANRINTWHYVVITGIPGIGKTEIARQYAHMYDDAYDHIQHLVYAGSLRETLAGLEIKNYRPSMKDEPIGICADQKLKVLEAARGKTLLIIDNYDREIILSQNLSNEGEMKDEIALLHRLKAIPNLDLVITSRRLVDLDHLDKERIYYLEELSPAELKALFIEIFPKAAREPELLDECLELVEYHTLTVVLLAELATTISQRFDDGVLAFLVPAIRSKKVRLEDVPVIHRKDGIAYKASIFDHILDLLEYGLPLMSEGERYVLTNLSLVPPKGILLEDFITGIGLETQGHGLPEPIQLVKNQGWLKLRDGKIMIHPVFAEVFAALLHPSMDENSCGKLVAHIVSESRANKSDYAVRAKNMDIIREISENVSGLEKAKYRGKYPYRDVINVMNEDYQSIMESNSNMFNPGKLLQKNLILRTLIRILVFMAFPVGVYGIWYGLVNKGFDGIFANLFSNTAFLHIFITVDLALLLWFLFTDIVLLCYHQILHQKKWYSKSFFHCLIILRAEMALYALFFGAIASFILLHGWEAFLNSTLAKIIAGALIFVALVILVSFCLRDQEFYIMSMFRINAIGKNDSTTQK